MVKDFRYRSKAGKSVVKWLWVSLVDCRLEVKFKGLMRLLEPVVKPTNMKEKQETLDVLDEYIIKNRRISSDLN